MKRFVEGADRRQSTLLPECLDDLIDDGNPVRAIDAFVDALDLAEMGFDGVDPAARTRSPAHVELMWLLARLVPDHKTITDFRKDSGRALAGYARASSNCAAPWDF